MWAESDVATNVIWHSFIRRQPTNEDEAPLTSQQPANHAFGTRASRAPPGRLAAGNEDDDML